MAPAAPDRPARTGARPRLRPRPRLLERLPASTPGILAWYSTIHLPPPELDRVLAGFRRLLAASGVLVIGFFDSDDDVTAFDHKVISAYRRPVDGFTRHLAAAGFTEVARRRQRFPERPDRAYAAIAARAT